MSWPQGTAANSSLGWASFADRFLRACFCSQVAFANVQIHANIFSRVIVVSPDMPQCRPPSEVGRLIYEYVDRLRYIR